MRTEINGGRDGGDRREEDRIKFICVYMCVLDEAIRGQTWLLLLK